MAGWVPARLRSLIAGDLDLIGMSELERLRGLPEDTDLDFKRDLYDASEGDSKELAYDVASFANATGGLLIIGIDEDGAGVASAVEGVRQVDRDVGLWIHQVVAARVFPTPRLVHRAIAIGERTIHVISVSPSVHRPHGVAAGGGALRYPLRSGTTRRFLAEAEVADAYRSRFMGLADQDQRVDVLQREGLELVPTQDDDEQWAWLVMSCVPDSPGGLELRQGVAEAWRDWIDPALREFPAFGPRQVRQASVGLRCLVLSDSLQMNDEPYSVGMRLYTDGSSVVILGHPGGRGSAGIRDGVVAVFDEHLLGDLVNAAGVLARHALRSGAIGAAAFAAQLRCNGGPMVLAQYRTMLPGVLHGTREVGGSTGIGRHSLPLEELATPGPDLVAGVRLLAGDLVSAFGLPEAQQVTSALALVLNRFHRDWQARVEAWSEAGGVTAIEAG